MQDFASDRDSARPERADRRRHHPRPERGRQDRPRPRQAAGRRPVRGDRRRRRVDRRHRRRGARTTAPRWSSATRSAAASGAAIRDGWKAGRRRDAPYLALLSGDDQHEPAELIRALDALAGRRRRLRPGLALDARAAASSARSAAAASAPASTRWSSAVLAGRRVTDATNGFRIFRAELLRDPQDRPRPGVARRATTSSRTCSTRRSAGGYRVIEVPVSPFATTQRGLHEDARPEGLVAPLPARAAAPDRGQAMSRDVAGALASAAAASSSPAAPASSVGASPAGSWTPAPGSPSSTTSSRAGRDGPDRSAQFVRRAPSPTRRSSASSSPTHGLVFHLAARNIIASTANPRDDYATNIGGHAERAPGRARLEGRPGRLHRRRHRSTATRASIPINEDDGLSTLSPYAVSKLGGEHYCTRLLRELRRAGVASSATRTSTGSASGRTTPTAA